MERRTFYVHDVITFVSSGNLVALALKLSQSERVRPKIYVCVTIKYVHVLHICKYFIYNILYVFHISHFGALFWFTSSCFSLSSDFLFGIRHYKCYVVKCFHFVFFQRIEVCFGTQVRGYVSCGSTSYLGGLF